MNKQEIIKQITELLEKLVEEPKPSRFQDQGDGTILDTQTNLVWEKECRKLTWNEATRYAKNLVLGGHSDWRLPSYRDLQTLLSLDRINPASDFPDIISNNFWSSSSYAGSPDGSWVMDFSSGTVYGANKSSNFYVRCVRGGPVAL